VAVYRTLVELVLVAHLLFIIWVALGFLLTRHHRWLRWLHIGCLVWGVLVEVTPWPCPLTLFENWLELRAGAGEYQGGFLLHYLDKLVYPDISPTILIVAGVAVCGWNLAFDVWFLISPRFRRW
jgi:hypothetical protein